MHDRKGWPVCPSCREGVDTRSTSAAMHISARHVKWTMDDDHGARSNDPDAPDGVPVLWLWECGICGNPRGGRSGASTGRLEAAAQLMYHYFAFHNERDFL